MTSATDAHLYPFTLAFKQGLVEGKITLAYAAEFCSRVYDAYLEECVTKASTEEATLHRFVVGGLQPKVTRDGNAQE